MKHLIATIAIVAVLLIPGLGHAQATGGTGKLGFQLSDYARVRINTPAFTGGLRQLNRASILAALDSGHVFDYTNDQNGVEPASLVSSTTADVEATVLTDNSYSNEAPNIRVRVTVYGWNNDDFIITKYTVINYASTSYLLYLGVAMSPQPSNAYGGESVVYNATKKIAYFYRSGETPHLGVKVVGGDPYSFHVLDYDAYSPADPGSDNATDTTRYNMTALPGFDGPLMTASADGSIYNLNIGNRTIPSGDSTSFSVAYVFSNDSLGLLAACDSADARYAGVFTSVANSPKAVPDNFALFQNYPNPFNPSTMIAFTLKSSAPTTLKVYDVVGREVATLVNGQLNAGAHRTMFDARNLASGVYYYRIVSGTFSETRKMLLMK